MVDIRGVEGSAPGRSRLVRGEMGPSPVVAGARSGVRVVEPTTLLGFPRAFLSAREANLCQVTLGIVTASGSKKAFKT